MSWRYVSASATGTSHLRAGDDCQDASFVAVAHSADGAEWLIALASDGAGSAEHGALGAQMMCEIGGRFLCDQIEARGEVALDARLASDCVSHVRAEIALASAWQGSTPRQFACTLVGAIVGRERALVFQIGDGAVVVRTAAPRATPDLDREGMLISTAASRGTHSTHSTQGTQGTQGTQRTQSRQSTQSTQSTQGTQRSRLGEGPVAVTTQTADHSDRLIPVFWPDSGEYANATYFVTDRDAHAHLNVTVMAAPDEVSLLTDGLQRLALVFATREAHPPFFEPMFATLRGIDPAQCLRLNADLAHFLSSAAINARTDDDKTLVIATRRAGPSR